MDSKRCGVHEPDSRPRRNVPSSSVSFHAHSHQLLTSKSACFPSFSCPNVSIANPRTSFFLSPSPTCSINLNLGLHIRGEFFPANSPGLCLFLSDHHLLNFLRSFGDSRNVCVSVVLNRCGGNGKKTRRRGGSVGGVLLGKTRFLGWGRTWGAMVVHSSLVY